MRISKIKEQVLGVTMAVQAPVLLFTVMAGAVRDILVSIPFASWIAGPASNIRHLLHEQSKPLLSEV